MKSVFSQIFVTIGIGSLVMLLLGTSASFLIVSDRLDRLSGPRTAHLAAEAAAQAHDGGREGLRRWLELEEKRGADHRLLVVDEHGRDLLDRPVPSAIESRHLDVMAAEAHANTEGLLPARWVPMIVLGDGERWAVYLVDRQPSLLARLGIPLLPLVLIALAVIASGTMAGLLARNFSRPIGELARATRALTAGASARLTGSPVTSRRDELGSLARDFDAMAVRLDHLLAAREHLIRDMSHELRTPLARLNVALELLRRKDPESRFAPDIDRIQFQADRLDHMIESILGLSKLDTMGTPPQFQALDFTELVADLVEEARPEAVIRECDLAFDARGALPVYANPTILASAVQNVLRNAIRHTAPGTRIDVAMTGAGGDASLSVRDQGSGVPTDSLPHLFEPFYRVDDSRGRDPGGTGLGLAIVAKVMQLHRGTAIARNRAAGGFEIVLTLPIMGQGIPQEPDFQALTRA